MNKKILSVAFLLLLIVSFISITPNVNAIGISEGAVIKTDNNPDVYIVKYKNGKQFKRLVLNPQVFESYGHLKWENILIVSQSEMNSFVVSDLVSVDGQTNIYQLVPNGDVGTKVLLASTAGYDLDSAYTINAVDFGNYVTEISIGYSRQNPTPIGISLITKEDVWYSDESHTVKITLLEIIRGERAWRLIENANMFNDPPEATYEFILAKVKVECLESAIENNAYDLSGYSFTAVSSSGKDYDYVSNVEPEPSLDAKLYEGASHTGWVSFQVSKNDLTPLMTFNREYNGTEGIWFKLY